MNRSWEDETYPTEVGMKSKIEELERELQDAKELLQRVIKYGDIDHSLGDDIEVFLEKGEE